MHNSHNYLNIHIYPNDLDYKVNNLLPLKWLRFECLMRESEEQFFIPEELMSKPGKLVYLSMGKFGSSDLDLMKRMTTILSESPNKFIVSKGSFHDKYELLENMWGLEMLPQISVLPLAHLVITCGDNKTITDAFYFSKPLVVLPLFGDQLDNAQRVKENGFGLTLNLYTCNKETLIGSVNTFLDDFSLVRTMSTISYRMQNSETIKKRLQFLLKIFDSMNNFKNLITLALNHKQFP